MGRWNVRREKGEVKHEGKGITGGVGVITLGMRKTTGRGRG